MTRSIVIGPVKRVFSPKPADREGPEETNDVGSKAFGEEVGIFGLCFYTSMCKNIIYLN